ncbi:hypothetical protein HHK36_030968 [Tetracentron sinense]|uniref:Glycosyltransferases n=1 Tax=Tetracentron sinense TaxID=13715 RepID=A0A834Y8R6_TETSI|nr:hypothetical protein HHK36_030968 [Tetracentron sinense]
MKLPALQQNYSNHRSNSFRTTAPLDSSADGPFKSPATLFWLLLHGLCCLISLVLGFRFSRIIFFLIFSTTTTKLYTVAPLFRTTTDAAESLTFQTPPASPPANRTIAISRSSSHVVVGRHGIRIRSWPHPNPDEVMAAHRIIERVQREQQLQYGIKNPKTLIFVTPTYVRTFQTLHLTGLIHSLMLVPYDLIWIVVEAGGTSNETAALLAKSGLRTIHSGFDERMPISWEDRRRMEARMRIRGLRIVREQRLDGIVMFADDSNMHSVNLFDEIQSVKWIGAVSIGILTHSGNSDESSLLSQKQKGEKNLPMIVQGPACNSSGHLVGWHTFNSPLDVEKNAPHTNDRETVLPRKLEWAGFVINSKLIWKEAEDKPEWVQDLDMLAGDGEEFKSPLSLLKDASFVEPLGNCGRNVMLWWLRAEARADSKFPPRWIIDPPLEIIVPAKRTTWPDAPPELPSNGNINDIQVYKVKRLTKTQVSRSRHGSRSKQKHEPRIADTQVSGRQVEER